MKLTAYLARENLSQAEFARRISVSNGTVSLLARDLIWMSAETAEKIAAATGGAVTAADFDRPPPRVKKKPPEPTEQQPATDEAGGA